MTRANLEPAGVILSTFELALNALENQENYFYNDFIDVRTHCRRPSESGLRWVVWLGGHIPIW